MSAVLRILGWKAVGLRCPDHELSFDKGSGQPYKVTLIQMPNGTGKTTTLALLRAALSGVAEQWAPEQVRSFQKRRPKTDRGYFELRLLLNNRRVTIAMEFDFEKGRVVYRTTRSPHGQQSGYRPPAEFRRYMQPDFVNFFVFDGELAEKLLDRTETNAEVAVTTLFQINLLDEVKQVVMDYWERQTQGKPKEQKGLTRRQNYRDKLQARLSYLLREKARLERERDTRQTELVRYRERYERELHRLGELERQIQDAESRYQEATRRVQDEASEILDRMRDPHALSATFAKEIYDFKQGLDRVKLPESAAREFFEELANESVCVCGRPIDAEIQQVIRERASRYLGSDNMDLLNRIKRSISEAVGNDLNLASQEVAEMLRNLERLMWNEQTTLQELQSLRVQADEADPAVKAASQEISRLETELAEIEQSLARFESDDDSLDDDRTFGIKVIKERLERAEKQLAEVHGTLTLKRKRDVLAEVLDEASRRARVSIAEELCMLTNQRIRELMPYNNISLAHIDKSLVLEGQEGGSVGETLSVAYAFLATLFNQSEHQLPFVVDSPANSIDLEVRPKIGELIPKLTSQFIAFTISSERDGFVDALARANPTEVQFLTLFRKNRTSWQHLVSESDVCIETTDGLCVTGKSFFFRFQEDDEEGN